MLVPVEGIEPSLGLIKSQLHHRLCVTGKCDGWSLLSELNRRLSDYETDALATELKRQISWFWLG